MSDESPKAQLYQATIRRQSRIQCVDDNAFHLHALREACTGQNYRDCGGKKVTALLPFGKNQRHELHELPQMTQGFEPIRSVQIREIRL